MIAILVGIICLLGGIWIGRVWTNYAMLKFMNKKMEKLLRKG